MNLVTPDIGLIFWSTLFFLILLFVLGKYAWPAILAAIVTRNENIRNALDAAEKAKKEMVKLQAENEKILAEAKAERDALLREAKEVRERIMAEAKEQASLETKKMIQSARESIRAEKAAAISDLKEQVAGLSVDIAEKILRAELKETRTHQELVSKLIKEADLN